MLGSNETEEIRLENPKKIDQNSSTATIPRKSKKSEDKNEVYKHNSVQPRGTNLRVDDMTNQMSLGHTPKQEVRIEESGYISGISDEGLRERIQNLFQEEKLKMSQNLMDQCKDYIDSRNMSPNRYGEDVMEEFYRFCKAKLPHDDKYKESIMFVSLFYYFMEKRKHLG